jgi:hypothetical protein
VWVLSCCEFFRQGWQPHSLRFPSALNIFFTLTVCLLHIINCKLTVNLSCFFLFWCFRKMYSIIPLYLTRG